MDSGQGFVMAKKSAKRRNVREEAAENRQQHYKLVDLFLQKSAMQRGDIRHSGMPPQAVVNASIAIGRIDGTADMIGVFAEFGATSTYEGEHSPSIVLDATYVLTYQMPAAMPAAELPAELLELFSQQAILNVWPYWREYVQSTTFRMGLPPLRLPLLFTGQVKERRKVD